MGKKDPVPEKKKTSFDIKEVGYVESVRKFVVVAKGLPYCINGQIVEFANNVLGLVIGFLGDKVQILVLGNAVNIRAGDEVRHKGKSLVLPASDKFLGRIVNGLCEPQDGLENIPQEELYPVFKIAPGVMERVPVDQTLETGTLLLDAIIPIAKGQRQLLIGDRLTGKTTVALDVILNQKDKDVVCIYCCIGKPYSALVKVIELLKEYDALKYTIVVSGVASMSTGEQYLAPYTACMLGEYFMNQGKDVFVVFDDLTKHAWVYRQVSLLLERAPGREAYPGDIFYIHSQLMERAGYLKPDLNGGSMTFFPIVEILQGDLTGYIPTNLISMTDGQLYFSTDLFNKGFKPAIDFGLSVSRIGNKAQWLGMKAESKTLRLDYLQYQELIKMTQLRTAGLSEDAEQKLRHGKAIDQLIIQDKNKPISIEEQIIYLIALTSGYLDRINEGDIRIFKEGIKSFIEKQDPGFLPKMREKQELGREMRVQLENYLNEYFKS